MYLKTVSRASKLIKQYYEPETWALTREENMIQTWERKQCGPVIEKGIRRNNELQQFYGQP